MLSIRPKIRLTINYGVCQDDSQLCFKYAGNYTYWVDFLAKLIIVLGEKVASWDITRVLSEPPRGVSWADR